MTLMDIYAVIYVERSTQKPIVLGAAENNSGHRRASPAEDRGFAGDQVYLDLHVKIAKDWQNSPGNWLAPGVLSQSAVGCLFADRWS